MMKSDMGGVDRNVDKASGAELAVEGYSTPELVELGTASDLVQGTLIRGYYYDANNMLWRN